MRQNKSFRLFVAINMPPSVQNEITRVEQLLVKQHLFEGKIIPPHHVHITLKFIGDVAQDCVPDIDTALHTIRAPALNAWLDGLDVFTAQSFIKIIFLNLVCPELSLLAKEIEDVLTPWVAKEERAFVAHMTIARIKHVVHVQQLLDALRVCTINPLEFTIDSFVLKKSELTPQGPLYTDVERYTLSSRH